ncbi:MAG: hypothetical protein H0U10_09300, partial [Chloroflexia bacterium]|nr:hypothetical protein [Chloroflexia bacterium]
IRGDGIVLGVDLDPFEDELAVEVQPSRLGDGMWLRPHHARWRARSLVAPTTAELLLAGRRDPAPVPYEAVGLDDVPLRYGRTYEVRVRMRDVTGGGPGAGAQAFHAGEAGLATWRMRRFVPLGQVRAAADPLDEDGLPPGFTLHRPRIGWPEAVYTGLTDAQAELEALLARATAPGGEDVDISLPDPDAEFVAFMVLVRQPRFDDFADEDGYIELYTAYRAFPPLAGTADPPVTVTLSWLDAARLDAAVTSPSTLNAPGSGPLPLPTGRDVRLVARAVARDDPGYFGAASARSGQQAVLLGGVVRRPETETPILSPAADADPCVSVFLRPDGPLPEADAAVAAPSDPSTVYQRRFAAAAGLVESGGSLLADHGERAAFGVFGLAHAMAPDNGSVRLETTADLPEKWLTVLRLTIERDWTWLAPVEPAFTIHRTLVNRTTGADVEARREIGAVPFPHVLNRQCAIGPQDRDGSHLIVIDAFGAICDADGLPHEIEARYEVTAHGYLGPGAPVEVSNRLPVTTPPTDVPRIMSAGHAFSDYEIVGDYQETGDRRRMLWLEFAEPPRDPRDIFFLRVLAHSPDPMLLPGTDPLADPAEYEKLVIDPELVRVVRPGQGEDFAGLAAMHPLTPARADGGRRPVHYLVPLPASLTPEAPELLGFFTYEIRVGHARAAAGTPFWSTASGRFGPGVVLEGVRHPAPTLPCVVARGTAHGVAVSSEFAVAVSQGRRVTTVPPLTEVWVVAYARVAQADAATKRNIQIDLRRAGLDERSMTSRSSRLVAAAGWSQAELRSTLATWGLPAQTPLGFVAVEVLPEPNGTFSDPIGGDLGQVRILRASRLVDAGDICC